MKGWINPLLFLACLSHFLSVPVNLMCESSRVSPHRLAINQLERARIPDLLGLILGEAEGEAPGSILEAYPLVLSSVDRGIL